jgi:uncharacterized membrane protein YiaA
VNRTAIIAGVVGFVAGVVVSLVGLWIAAELLVGRML